MIIPPRESLSFLSQLIDVKKQKQQAGIDLTLKKVFAFVSEGVVDFSNEKRKVAEVKELEFDSEGKVGLPPGAYKVVFNEYFKVPKNAAGFFLTRTTLLRSGAAMFSGLWDPGFEGMAESLLVVYNPFGITLYKNARIAQIVFFHLKEEAEEEYSGIYKNLRH